MTLVDSPPHTPPPPAPSRRSRPVVLVAVVLVAVLAAGVAVGRWSDREPRRVPPGTVEVMRVVAPENDRTPAFAMAISMATGLVRQDGMLYGEWVKQRVHRLCPPWPASSLTFGGSVNVNGDGTGYVEVYVHQIPNTRVPDGATVMCPHFGAVAWVHGPIARVASSRYRGPDPQVPDEAAGSRWLEEFWQGVAP